MTTAQLISLFILSNAMTWLITGAWFEIRMDAAGRESATRAFDEVTHEAWLKVWHHQREGRIARDFPPTDTTLADL